MDELDTAILESLQADGRRSNRDLAAALGVAPSTTLERVRALRARGVLTGVHASVDLAKLGRPVQAMVTVRLRPQSRQIIQEFRDFVLQLPQTLQVFVTTGTEDLLVHVAVPSTEALRDFVLDSVTKRREVAGVRTDVVFDHLENHVVAPIPRA
ncbi:Lrp/AsnC family transcriptional regulator [Mycolicibacterium flavescens]|uniref:AsnC family transcriptional regulator n=1 Tax=Mycolicibacterium flavescens TaxID=1776 RepID=A0A1E3RQN4_MYCFV|nr:Lrp/AsnC family transcriptional regulator [Mycolicibacterium flavescens]MCV7279569.1 Lrp/AsnC family transcriptional regulator [Mycolicibacterium flavescens]ODQ92226.1 AsnC family transcriptional regulator [Mycolicibacterium flavescens]